jgi:hypothetical protein
LQCREKAEAAVKAKPKVKKNAALLSFEDDEGGDEDGGGGGGGDTTAARMRPSTMPGRFSHTGPGDALPDVIRLTPQLLPTSRGHGAEEAVKARTPIYPPEGMINCSICTAFRDVYAGW